MQCSGSIFPGAASSSPASPPLTLHHHCKDQVKMILAKLPLLPWEEVLHGNLQGPFSHQDQFHRPTGQVWERQAGANMHYQVSLPSKAQCYETTSRGRSSQILVWVTAASSSNCTQAPHSATSGLCTLFRSLIKLDMSSCFINVEVQEVVSTTWLPTYTPKKLLWDTPRSS